MLVIGVLTLSGRDGGGGQSAAPADLNRATESGAWVGVPDDAQTLGGVGNQQMVAVTVGGTGLVSVGWDDSGSDRDAAVWTSADGSNWTRVSHDEAVFGGSSDQVMNDVVATGSGLVAVGYEGSGYDSDAAVWTSSDANTWQRVPHDEVLFGGPDDQEMTGVTAGGPGLIAVGYDDQFGYGYDAKPGAATSAHVWVSSDGRSWSRTSDFGTGKMHDVLSFGSGFVGVGSAVWTSSDGVVWSQAPAQEGLASGTMLAAWSTGSEMVAVGQTDDSSPAGRVWASPDGAHWSRIPEDEQVFGDGFSVEAAMYSVTARNSEFVAVGAVNKGDDADAAVWSSSDGIAWRVSVPFIAPGDQLMKDVLPFGAGLIAVGVDGSRGVGDDDAAVWISR